MGICLSFAVGQGLSAFQLANQQRLPSSLAAGALPTSRSTDSPSTKSDSGSESSLGTSRSSGVFSTCCLALKCMARIHFFIIRA